MIVAAASVLGLVHIAVCIALGSRSPGPLLSDLIPFILGVLLIAAMMLAANRSQGMGHAFWRLTTSAYLLLLAAQGLSVYNHFAPTSAVSRVANLLLCFWFAPLAMAPFLDPARETRRIDAEMALDFVQGILVCVSAYAYFFYLPYAAASAEGVPGAGAACFAAYGLVALAFVLRSTVTRSRDVRVLFGSMGALLAVSGFADALYHHRPGPGLKTGQWFDIVRSALLLAPLLIASAWKQVESPENPLEAQPREKYIHGEISSLLYPMLVLFMSLRIAREHLTLAALMAVPSFLCSSARMLVTQSRLMLAKEALRREAKRDSLTGLWNHKAVMEILERELLRSERDYHPVGVIMVDVDDFKRVNDSRGHAAGDAVLRIIASGIAAMVRPYDSVGRYGGEEFLIIAPGCGQGETWELAERVRTHVARSSIMAAGAAVQVTLSLGIATGECAADLEKVLGAADAAMYRAKAAGRNRVEPVLGRAAGRGSAFSGRREFLNLSAPWPRKKDG